MTTAHRATWRSARGGDQEDGSFRLHVGTAQVSAKAAPSHCELKTRDNTDNTTNDRAKLRQMLDNNEKNTTTTTITASGGADDNNLFYEDMRNPDIRALDDDALLDDDTDIDEDEYEISPRAPKRARTNTNTADSDEDDEELLRRELEKIRAERAARKEAEEEDKETTASGSVLGVNPLLLDFDDTASIATATTNASAVSVKRRWNDDVIFKNKARPHPNSSSNNTRQRFVNDTVRNDFHRKFLRRYIL